MKYHNTILYYVYVVKSFIGTNVHKPNKKNITNNSK